MKHLLLIPALLLAFACNDANRDGENDENKNAGNVEEHSGENISPQLENQGDGRYSVDTVSDAGEVNEEKKEELR